MPILSTWLCPSTTTWSKPSDAECWSLALFVPVLNAYDRAICLVFFVAGDMARIADMVYLRWSWNPFFVWSWSWSLALGFRSVSGEH